MIEEKLDLKSESIKGELEYAPIPPSGRGNKEHPLTLNDILPKLKPFSIRKPIAFIVGSLANQGESNNDIDIVIRGEDWSEELRTAFDFRLLRHLSDILGVPYDDIPKYVSLHYNNTGPFTAYVPIYELTAIPLNNPQIIQMSYTPFDLQVCSDEDRVIAGFASVPIVDLKGQKIPNEVLKKALDEFLSKPDFAHAFYEHRSIIIGDILPEYKGLKTEVKSNGLFVVVRLRKDLDIANKVWEDIKAGKLHYFSIGLEIREGGTKEVCEDASCYIQINDMRLFDCSVVEKPANPSASLTVVKSVKEESKNMEQEEIKVEEQKQMVQENIQQEEEKKKKKEEKEEEEEEDKEECKAKTIEDEIKAVLKKDIPEEVKALLNKILDFLGKYPYPYPAKYPHPSKYPYPTKYPYPAKKDEQSLDDWADMVVKAIDDIYDNIQQLSKINETLKQQIQPKEMSQPQTVFKDEQKQTTTTNIRRNVDGSVSWVFIPQD